MIKAIFWDNDGILVDTERLYFQATQTILAQVGVTLTEAMYIDLFLAGSKGAWHLASEKGLSAAEVEGLRDARNDLYGQYLANEPLVIEGVRETLDQLHGKCMMAIVTGSRRDHFDLIHRSTDLLPYFDFVLTSEDYGNSKPDPEAYLLALQKSGLALEACVVVEDSERGFVAATRAGLGCYIVPTPLTRNGNFEGARGVLSRITDLPPRLFSTEGVGG